MFLSERNANGRMEVMSKAESTDRAGWSVDDWKKSTGLGRTKVFQLIGEREIEVAKVGRRTIILTTPAEFLRRHARAA